MKRYFTVNQDDFSINQIFESLKEIRQAFPKIDILDYIDDLDENFEGLFFVSENYLSDLLKKTKNEDDVNSLKDMITLKEQLDTLNEEFNQTKIELDTTHKEYVTLLDDKKKNFEKLSALGVKLSELESNKNKLELEKLELIEKLKEVISTNEETIKKIKNASLSVNVEKVKTRVDELYLSLLDINSELDKLN